MNIIVYTQAHHIELTNYNHHEEMDMHCPLIPVTKKMNKKKTV